MPKEQIVVGEEGTPTLTQVSGEQDETTTILTFVNAVSLVCPPMVIHCGQRVQEYWTHEAPIGICVAATTKGYITKAKFHEYGIHFVRYLNSHKLLDRPHILLIDSHKTHVYNLPFFDEMRENNIHVMAIPPNTSHIVQALDSTPFAQFKKNLQKLLSEWNFDNHGSFLGKGQFFEVMWPAWKHAMSIANIQSGFCKTGIFPVNFDGILKSKFTPSQVTDSKNCCSC